MPGKPIVAVLFGGSSTEYEVSLVSARGVLENIDRERYQVLEVGIATNGQWFCGPGTRAMLSRGASEAPGVSCCSMVADPVVGGLLLDQRSGENRRIQPLDFVLPMIHGSPGEDGRLQGLLEMAGIPYAGPPADASALSFDKDRTKVVCVSRGVPVAAWRAVEEHHWAADPDGCAAQLIRIVGLPCFVKPARGGSSVGIGRVDRAEALPAAMDQAFRFDDKLLVEEAVAGREIECAVLGNREPRVSVPGEVIPGGLFYDYRAKYLDQSSETVVPADIPVQAADEISRLAAETFKALGLRGMARVDFFLVEETGAVVLNEVNTIPGFTPISMYPMLWEASGLDFTGLIDELIRLGFERHHLLEDKVRSIGLDPEQARMVGQTGGGHGSGE
jgi:D-alanine-D-alanine ligase